MFDCGVHLQLTFLKIFWCCERVIRCPVCCLAEASTLLVLVVTGFAHPTVKHIPHRWLDFVVVGILVGLLQGRKEQMTLCENSYTSSMIVDNTARTWFQQDQVGSTIG